MRRNRWGRCQLGSPLLLGPPQAAGSGAPHDTGTGLVQNWYKMGAGLVQDKYMSGTLHWTGGNGLAVLCSHTHAVLVVDWWWCGGKLVLD